MPTKDLFENWKIVPPRPKKGVGYKTAAGEAGQAYLQEVVRQNQALRDQFDVTCKMMSTLNTQSQLIVKDLKAIREQINVLADRTQRLIADGNGHFETEAGDGNSETDTKGE